MPIDLLALDVAWPKPARLPSVPSDAHMQLVLATFDAMADRDTARRLASATATARPPKRRGK